MDTIYSTGEVAGSNIGRIVYHLGANGVARRLYSWGWGAATGGKFIYGGSEELAYSYMPPTPEAPTTARLVFSGGTMTPDGATPLIFETSRSGHRGVPTYTSFTFKTRVALTGAVNVSNRLWLHAGETNITGFVSGGGWSVLVRGVGPSLARFGVAKPVSSTAITVYSGQQAIRSNAQWGTGTDGPDAQGLAWMFELVDAFPLNQDSLDSVVFLEGVPAPCTIHVTPGGELAEPGEALVEVYLLPYQ